MTTLDRQKICRNCKYFLETPAMECAGMCYRHPEPKRIENNGHWCGEFKARTINDE